MPEVPVVIQRLCAEYIERRNSGDMVDMWQLMQSMHMDAARARSAYKNSGMGGWQKRRAG